MAQFIFMDTAEFQQPSGNQQSIDESVSPIVNSLSNREAKNTNKHIATTPYLQLNSAK